MSSVRSSIRNSVRRLVHSSLSRLANREPIINSSNIPNIRKKVYVLLFKDDMENRINYQYANDDERKEMFSERLKKYMNEHYKNHSNKNVDDILQSIESPLTRQAIYLNYIEDKRDAFCEQLDKDGKEKYSRFIQRGNPTPSRGAITHIHPKSFDCSKIGQAYGRKNRKGKKGKKPKKTKNNRLKSDKNKSKKNKRRKGSRKK